VTANAAPSAHIIPSEKPLNPGMAAFRPNRANHSRTTAATPGHKRTGFRRLGSSLSAVVIIRPYALHEPVVPWFLRELKSRVRDSGRWCQLRARQTCASSSVAAPSGNQLGQHLFLWPNLSALGLLLPGH
jgi:hypothetical protein